MILGEKWGAALGGYLAGDELNVHFGSCVLVIAFITLSSFRNKAISLCGRILVYRNIRADCVVFVEFYFGLVIKQEYFSGI